MAIAIGDIHGCLAPLRRLVERLPEGEALIFLGDYIDKLPHTQETLALLSTLQKEHQCVFLRGNHEFVWDRYVNGGELERQEFLLQYGGEEALSEYGREVQKALEKNDLPVLKDALKPYFLLMDSMKDWYLVDDYLALHAGLLQEQYEESPLVFTEKNFFVRPNDIPPTKKYLDRYVLVAGHTYLGDEPTTEKGYINIDLGAGYEKFIGALSVDDHTIIRSDGEKFSVLQ